MTGHQDIEAVGKDLIEDGTLRDPLGRDLLAYLGIGSELAVPVVTGEWPLLLPRESRPFKIILSAANEHEECSYGEYEQRAIYEYRWLRPGESKCLGNF